ncbi:MAG: DNA repair protein RecO [Candidatus Dojkabacteria bacterium]|nr:MAG: DNA repair protein RecO [Candidatus Dojkabacteria bacterium]
MNQLKDQVIIIKSVNYSEADKILTVFGRNRGKFSIIAKGIRKITSKNRGNMQTLSVTEITYFEGKNLGILKESNAVVLVPPEDIDMDSAKRLLFVLNKLLPEAVPEEEIFEMAVGVISEGIKAEDLNRFRIKFLQNLGYINEMSLCNVCGKKVGKQDYLDPHAFKVICENCARNINEVSRASHIRINEIPIGSSRMGELLDRVIEQVLHA